MSRLAADVSMLLTQVLDLREAVISDEVPPAIVGDYGRALKAIPKPDFNNAGEGRQERMK